LNTFSATSSSSRSASVIFKTLKLNTGDNIIEQQLCNGSCIDKSLQFSVIGGENPYLNYAIICRSDGVVASIPQNVLGNLYFNAFRERFSPIFTKTIRNLLKVRNHLLLQLDLECGNISEEYFDKEEPKYLSEVENIPLEKLKEEIKVLFGFTSLPFDAEDISEILNCSVDDAEKVLKYFLDEVLSCQPLNRVNP